MNKDIYEKVAVEIGEDPKYVEDVYKAYWRCIKSLIEKLPLKDDISEEEFNKLTVNFNIASLGKLCILPTKFKYRKKHYDKYKKN